MSTLVLVLAAGITIPGNGPEMVSAEMERGLDLSGTWEGTWHWTCGVKFHIELCQGKMTAIGPAKTSWITDEGRGFCRFSANKWVMLGIYEQHQDRVMICFREGNKERPRSFTRTDEQHLLILHRVTPRK
jgi:hypothetical protein